MTTEEFMANPYVALSSSGGEAPAELVRSAWQTTALRDDVVYELARSVSKVGSFELASEFWLRLLPTVLTAEEVPDLYVAIRDESQRLEFEWRPAFEAAFNAQRGSLPSPQDEEILSGTLLRMIESGYAAEIQAVIVAVMHLPARGEVLRKALERARELERTALVSILEEAVATSASN